jgi:hypothetical protein
VDESSLCEIFRDISQKLVQLAKIPNPVPEEIPHYFNEVPLCWIDPALSVAFSDDDQLAGLLSDIKHNARALRRRLEKLHHRFEGTDKRLRSGRYDDVVDDLDLTALQRLQTCTENLTVSDFRRELTKLEVAINHLIPRGRGRRRGVKHYPGLSELVFWLETYAQYSGGAFTAHRKVGAKGSLVQALDRLRDRFLTSSNLKYLADLIPTPGKHPIAAYERTLKAARKAARMRIERCESPANFCF